MVAAYIFIILSIICLPAWIILDLRKSRERRAEILNMIEEQEKEREEHDGADDGKEE